MYFSSAFALAALPFFVGAVPVQNSARSVLSIPLSKRSTHLDADNVVDIQSLQASAHHTAAKFERGFIAFERNTGIPHPLVAKQGHKRRDVTTISLTDHHQNTLSLSNITIGTWYGDISVGTPATKYTVVFDTGTAALFLPGTSCSNCIGHHIYDPTQSSTAKDLGTDSGGLDYLNGGITRGELFTDNISAGGLEAVNQTLFVAADEAYSFNSTYFGADGIMGMGFKESSPLKAATFFETLVDQGKLEEPVIGFYLAESDPELIIGGRNSSRYSGNLTYVNVEKQGYWQTAFDGISVNGNNISVSTRHAIIDTGTTLVIGDPSSISNIYAQIPGSTKQSNTGLWTIPCDTNVTISMKFNGTTFNISPKTYNVGTISTVNTGCVGGFRSKSFSDPTFWVIGDVFLRNVYTEFDYGKLRVGFAQLA